LGKSATAANAAKLGGHLPSYFATATSLDDYYNKSTSDNRYLRKGAKAADSDKLDGKHASAFALKTDLNDIAPPMYTGNDGTNVDYPIGTLLCCSPYGTNGPVYLPSPNHATPVYADAAGGSLIVYTRGGGGSSWLMLTGTWVCRGRTGPIGDFTGALMQRIS
ncbi:hypothetical protein SAMN04488056_13012, partial [Cohaesibacter marisflavi]